MSSLASLALILIFFAAGYITSRTLKVPPAVPQKLNKAVIHFIFPAIILLNIPNLELQREYIFLLIAPWLIIGVTTSLLLLVNLKYQWDKSVLCACLVLAALGNTGNLGFPMLQAFFSNEQASLGIIFDQLGTFIALCTYVSILISLFSGGGRVSPISLLRRIFQFPPFITLLVAFLLPPDFLPDFVKMVLRYISYSIIPLTMFGIGMQFSFKSSAEAKAPLIWTLGLKMALAPLVILIAGSLGGIPDTILEVAVFQAAMPPVVAGVVMLIAQGLAPKFAVSTLGFGTLISMVYLPVLAWVLNLS